MAKIGKAITTTDGHTPLRTSAIVSRSLTGNGFNIQIEPEGEEYRTASVLINADGDLVIGCLKNFVFRKRANGGFTMIIPGHGPGKPLFEQSGKIIESVIEQYKKKMHSKK